MYKRYVYVKGHEQFKGSTTEHSVIANPPFSRKSPNSLFLLFSAYSLLEIRDLSNKMVKLFFYFKETTVVNRSYI